MTARRLGGRAPSPAAALSAADRPIAPGAAGSERIAAAARPGGRGRPPSQAARELLAVLVILLLAAVVRLPFLTTIPWFTDETLDSEVSYAVYRGWALPLHSHEQYIGSWQNYLEAAGFALSGGSPLAPRGVVFVLGVLAVGAGYLLARQALPRPAALLAGALLATSGAHAAFSSHVAYSHSTTPLYLAAGLALLLRAAATRSGPALAAAGLLLGLALQTHPTAVAFLPGAGLFLLFSAPALLRTRWPPIAAGLFLLAYANLIVHNLTSGFGSVTANPRGVFGGGGVRSEVVSESLLALPRLVAGAVDARPEPWGYLADPVVLAYTALALGGLVLLARAGNPLPSYVLLSGLLMLPFFATDSSAYDVPPHQGRYLTPLLPLLLLCVAAAAWALWERLEPRLAQWGLSRTGRGALGLLAGALLVLVPLVSLVRYYGQEQRVGRTNEPYYRLVATVEATRAEGQAVLLDTTLSRELGLGGSAMRTLRYLFLVRDIPWQPWRAAEGVEAWPRPGSLVVASSRTVRSVGTGVGFEPLQSAIGEPFGLYRVRAPAR